MDASDYLLSMSGMFKSSGFCCEQFEQQINHTCEQHGKKCPDRIIRDYGEKYGILHVDNVSYIKIDYCPFCGSKL